MKALISGTHGIPSGGGGCAAHRPPHRKQKNAKRLETKKTWLRHEYMHLVSKCDAQQNACQNMFPKPSKTKPGQPPNPPKSRLGESLGVKMHSRSGPSQPRSGQERPTITQEASKRGQEPPQRSRKPAKWHPRATLERFGALQNPARRAPRRGWSRIFVGSFVRHAPEVILYRFSACATSSRYVKTRENLGKIVVFTHQELCRSECSQSRRNFRK